jgi:hypothetical protein
MHATVSLIRSAVGLALIAGAVGCAAQNPGAANTEAPPSPPALANDAAPPPRAVLPRKIPDSAVVSSAAGVVKRYTINPEGDIDGLLLADDTLINFPPHLGGHVAATVAPGESVRATGFSASAGSLRAQQIANAASGRTVIDQPPPADTPRLPKALRGVGLVKLDVSGRVLRATTAPRGEPDGVLLADGTIVKLTPPVALQFPNLLQAGATIAARGYGTRNRYGAALQATSFGTPGHLTSLYGTSVD